MQASKDILWTFTMLTEKLLFRRGLKTHVFSSEMFVLLVRIQREMAAPTAKSIDVVIDRKKGIFFSSFPRYCTHNKIHFTRWLQQEQVLNINIISSC